MRKPDFVIVGAPRSGTTAMAEYLRQHPAIYMPPATEIHFFGTDLAVNYPAHTRGPKRYLAWFQPARYDQVVGEKSIWYLYSKRAAHEIRALAPQARIIMILRHPVEMLYALHSQLLFTGNETLPDFASALEAEVDRQRRLRVPKSPFSPQLLFYREIGKYAEQVQRYLEAFGREQVRIILFDDFVEDTARVYRETLTFLGVNGDFQPAFTVVNPNKEVRSRAVARFVANLSPGVQRWSRDVLQHPWLGRGLRLLQRMNARYAPRPPMNPLLRQRLQAEFAPEVARLGALLGRDLTHWSAS